MASANIKQQAHELIDKLPDNATWHDVVYEIVVRREIELGLADSDANHTIPAEDVLKEFSPAMAKRLRRAILQIEGGKAKARKLIK